MPGVPQVTVTVIRPGDTPVDLTDKATGARWATAAVGGYSDATFTLPGPPQRWRKQVPHLARLKITYGPRVLFDGQIEDIGLRVGGGDVSTVVQAFGMQRLLTEASVHRIWSKRNINWVDANQSTQLTGDAPTGVPVEQSVTGFQVTLGQFDQTDLSRSGMQILDIGYTFAAADRVGGFVYYRFPTGITIVRVMFDLTCNNATMQAFVDDSTDGSTWTNRFRAAPLTKTAENVSLGVAPTVFAIGAAVTGGASSVGIKAQLENIRILGTSLTEDTAGGFYGGTILNDLIALVPGLTLGTIETGSDFTIQSIERAVRSSSLDVVQEIASYYSREWAVWEDGRFDWKTPDLNQPQWLVTLADLANLELDASVDTLTRTSYVLYTDVATGADAEQSSASLDQRNPYVKQGRTKDGLTTASAQMTGNSAGQLAVQVAADSVFPSVTGRIEIPAGVLVPNPVGSPQPAYTIRGGDNILIADLPKTEPFRQGRDGETLFHIVSTDLDPDRQIVTLELEGQTRRSDLLLARLAAVTRTITG